MNTANAQDKSEPGLVASWIAAAKDLFAARPTCQPRQFLRRGADGQWRCVHPMTRRSAVSASGLSQAQAPYVKPRPSGFDADAGMPGPGTDFGPDGSESLDSKADEGDEVSYESTQQSMQREALSPTTWAPSEKVFSARPRMSTLQKERAASAGQTGMGDLLPPVPNWALAAGVVGAAFFAWRAVKS